MAARNCASQPLVSPYLASPLLIWFGDRSFRGSVQRIVPSLTTKKPGLSERKRRVRRALASFLPVFARLGNLVFRRFSLRDLNDSDFLRERLIIPQDKGAFKCFLSIA